MAEQRFQIDKAMEADIHIDYIATALGMPRDETARLLEPFAQASILSPADFYWNARQSARNGWITAEDLRNLDGIEALARAATYRMMGFDPSK